MALLTSALNKGSPWIDAPEEQTMELSQFISSDGPYDDSFQSGHGCFAPGVGVVLEPPGWFRPDLVRTGASPSPGAKVPG